MAPSIPNLADPLPSRTAVARDRQAVPSQAARGARFDPACTAAAIALGLVFLSTSVHPWVPAGSWLDAVINEWLIWFAGLFLACHFAAAAVERVAVLFGRRTERLSVQRPGVTPSATAHPFEV
ncbi:MAG: hypothetical protein HY332_21065 [Chloroflexi bacterium]|nr:hypothetical protein [Chloroflexota bacterium]